MLYRRSVVRGEIVRDEVRAVSIERDYPLGIRLHAEAGRMCIIGLPASSELVFGGD